MLRITNLSGLWERGGISIPFGESLLSEADWNQFLSFATDDAIQLPLRTGAISAAPNTDLPDNLNSLNYLEAKRILETVKDAQILKKWLIAAHDDEKFWRQRLLIKSRFSLLGLNASLSDVEIAHLDTVAPWRYSDAYRRHSDMSLADKYVNPAQKGREERDMKKRAMLDEIFKEYQSKIQEIEQKCS